MIPITNPNGRHDLFHKIISTFTNNNNTVSRDIAIASISLRKIVNPSFEFMNTLGDNYSKALFNTSFDVYCIPDIKIQDDAVYNIALYNSAGHFFKKLNDTIDGFVETIVRDGVMYIIMNKDKSLCMNGILIQLSNDKHGLIISDTDISDDTIIHLKDNLYMKSWFNYINILNIPQRRVDNAIIKNNTSEATDVITNNGILIEVPDNKKTISNSLMILYTKDDTINYKIITVDYLFWNKDKAILDKSEVYEKILYEVESGCTIDSMFILLEDNINIHMEAEEIYTDIYRYWNQNNLAQELIQNDCVGYYLKNISDTHLKIDFSSEDCYDSIREISPLISTIMLDAEYSSLNKDVEFDNNTDTITFKVINPKSKYMCIFINGVKFNKDFDVFHTGHYSIVTVDKELIDNVVDSISVVLMNGYTHEYNVTYNDDYPNVIKLEHNPNQYETMIYIDGLYIHEHMYQYLEIDGNPYIVLLKSLAFNNVNILYTKKSSYIKTTISRAELISSFIDFKDALIFAGGLLLSNKYLFNIEGRNIVNINIPKSYVSAIDNDIVIYKKVEYDSNMYHATCIKNIMYITDDSIHLLPYNVLTDFAQSNKMITLANNDIYEGSYCDSNDIIKLKYIIDNILIGKGVVNLGDNIIYGNDITSDTRQKYNDIINDDVITIDSNDTYLKTIDFDCNQ